MATDLYSVAPGKLKSLHDHGGNRTRDLWDTSPMLYQLSYVVKSVRVGDILELSLVSSISMYINVLTVAQLVEHWTSIPKVAGSIPTVGCQANFSACPLWMHSQSNTTNITLLKLTFL